MTSLKSSLRDPILAIVLGGALVIRLIAVPVVHQLGFTSDEREFVFLANGILQGTGFVDSNGTESVRAPFFPLVLAAALYLDSGAYALAHILGVLLGVLGVWLIFQLSFAVFNNRQIALWATVLAAFYPGLVTYSAMMQTETLFIVFFLLAMLLLQRFLEAPRVSVAVLLGLCSGLAGMTRAVFVPFFPLLLLVLLVLRLRSGWVWVRQILIAAFAFIIVLLPWGIRNYGIHQRVVPVSTFAGPSLLLGNNPFTTGTTRLQDGFNQWFFESVEGKTGRSPEELSEIQRADISREIAVEYITAHPRRFGELLLRKSHVLLIYPITNSDSYVPAQLVAVIADGFLLLLATAGLVLASCGRRAMWGLVAVCAFFVGAHVVLHAEARYRLPLVPLLCVLGGAGAAGLLSVEGRKRLLESRGQATRLALIWFAIVALYGATGWMFLHGSVT